MSIWTYLICPDMSICWHMPTPLRWNDARKLWCWNLSNLRPIRRRSCSPNQWSQQPHYNQGHAAKVQLRLDRSSNRGPIGPLVHARVGGSPFANKNKRNETNRKDKSRKGGKRNNNNNRKNTNNTIVKTRIITTTANQIKEKHKIGETKRTATQIT